MRFRLLQSSAEKRDHRWETTNSWMPCVGVVIAVNS